MHSSPRIRGPRGPEVLDICRLISVIEEEVGVHLEQLDLDIGQMHGSVLPGQSSLRGFQKLDCLGLSLETATCNTNRDISAKYGFHHSGLSLCSIVPTSVSKVILYTRGREQDENCLELMFRNFETKKDSQLSNLQEIRLHYSHGNNNVSFKNNCAKLATETAKQGLIYFMKTISCFPRYNTR
jgi:hypothetical protein